MHQISHFFGTIFAPIFHAIGWMLSFFYDLVPNYIFAIAALTVVIMGILTPLTVKSTKSMISMQRLQPEIKKLQQKYKGPENRQLLNEEMMKLYREEGVNPVGGCLPLMLQMPFLFILYSTIKGLAFTVTSKSGKITPEPRYIPKGSKIYENLIHSGGHINVWGMDLSLHPFPISAHGSWVAAIPFFLFVAAAVFLQYFQMAQINNRNKKTGQPMPSQQQTMQRVMPIIFAYFYLVIPAAVVIYMIISTGIRIITQDVMFRTGISNPHKNGLRPIAGANGVDATSEVIATEEKPSSPKPAPKPTNQPRPKQSQPRSASRPAPRPQQSQARSKAKRKRKAR
jgi:YidC/Oxa1 family membrane protein insertase